jgi:V-type H+-transporting ATPase proteolipid subunit
MRSLLGKKSLTSCAVFGAAYGTAKSGVGISTMGVVKPELVMRAIIPVIFAGVGESSAFGCWLPV